MRTITPCLWFDGNGEEAARYYCSILPDSGIDDITYYGPEMPGQEGAVLTVGFHLGGRAYTALNGGPQFPFTEAVSLQVHCETAEENDRFYDALVDGGETAPCGWLTDRYGFSWQIIPPGLLEWMNGDDRAAAQRVTKVMLATHGKLDPAALEAAHRG
ncbi:VOC family protein [Pseudonocardia nematodicida]|uniref:VOC family protein n=1 Tax=Pseudonocardia nematodicida TaxID=1206997 RepID=A0ABV1KGC0_9PSEU